MLWLTERQITELTRHSQPAAQIRMLVRSGIPHRVVDGRPIVMARDISPPSLEAMSASRDNDRPQLRLTRRHA